MILLKLHLWSQRSVKCKFKHNFCSNNCCDVLHELYAVLLEESHGVQRLPSIKSGVPSTYCKLYAKVNFFISFFLVTQSYLTGYKY